MIIDALDKVIQLKVVYFGPALSGKTTSILSLFRHFGKEKQVKCIESSIKRTLFFDYGTISFQNARWKLKVHLYSTTGQDFYIVTRPITLQAIDGVIFVIDSQQKAYLRNILSWDELKTYFDSKFITLPKVLSFNKQDLPNKFNQGQFLREIGYQGLKNIRRQPTIALNGEGILSSFEEMLGLILQELHNSQLSLLTA